MNDNITYEGLKLFSPGRAKPEKPTLFGPSIKYEYYSKKNYENETDNSLTDKFPDIQKGVTVMHNTFGKGTVLSTTGKGLDKKAEIYFDDIGLKKIILKYAKMTIEE